MIKAINPFTITISYGAVVAGLRDRNIGKRVGTSLYLHRSALTPLALDLIDELGMGDEDWDVVKFGIRESRLSLLWYPGFVTKPFPELVRSRSIVLASGRTRDSNYNPFDPPIIHRKELMLKPDHHCVPNATMMTHRLEAYGLLDKPPGRKQAWEALLMRHGWLV